MEPHSLLVFPKCSNKVVLAVLSALLFLPMYVGALLAYGANPETLHVGYMPEQPVAYSHALHVGKLGIDCRYCHNTVETSGFSAIPPTETCMNCHKAVLPDSPKLTEVVKSYQTGEPIPWVKVHSLPDYVYFNHSAHVNSGVSCVSCHGQVNQMETVYQAHPLNMAWCLSCHREPEKNIRPRDQVTNLDWVAPANFDYKTLAEQYQVYANTDCVTCHR